MPTAITGSERSKLGFEPEKAESLSILSALKSQLTRSDGSLKSGVLKLMHTTPGSPGSMTFERKGWWQFWARRDAKMNATAAYLLVLLRQAYGDAASAPPEVQTVMEDFQKYLASRSNRIGTRSLHRFLTRFEKALALSKKEPPPPLEKMKVQPLEAESAPRAFLISSIAAKSKSLEFEEVSKLANLLIGALDLPNGEDPRFEHLGSGGFGTVEAFTGEDGNRHALKIIEPESVCKTGDSATLKGRELCVAKLTDDRCTGIVKPTFYLIRCRKDGKEDAFKVPSAHIKRFLRGISPDVHTAIVGIIMPLVEGNPLKMVLHQPEDLKIIAARTVETLARLAGQHIVHSDIKPDNIIYNAKSKEVKIIDTGLMSKMPKRKGMRQLFTHIEGTPKYMHPNVLRSEAYGCEADLFSLAITLIKVRYPEAYKAISNERLREVSAANPIFRPIISPIIRPNSRHSGWENRTGRYLENLIAATLKDSETGPEARAQLLEMQNALKNPATEDGKFMSFLREAFNISFITQEDYQDRIEELRQHEFVRDVPGLE